MDKRELINQMDNRMLYLNLVITQGVLFIVGVLIYMFFLRSQLSIFDIYHLEYWFYALVAGLVFACIVVLIDVYLIKKMPDCYFDDGGINERVFRDVNILQIALIALFVALVEEFLFRAVLQNWLGLFWASLLFALIHFRYFKKWLYAAIVLILSFGFGFLYEWTRSMWSVVFAHFLIDFALGIMIRYRILVHITADESTND